MRPQIGAISLFWRAACVIDPAQSETATAETRAPARRRTCYESGNSPELSYDYGRDDRRHRVSNAFHLGQGRRQAEPRYRPQIAPRLDRRRPAADGPRRPRFAVSEEVLGLPQERLRLRSLLPRSNTKRPCRR